jgi:hypothetical protein
MASFSSPPRRQRGAAGTAPGQSDTAEPVPPPPTTPSNSCVPPDESKISSPLISISIRNDDDDNKSPSRAVNIQHLAKKARFPASQSSVTTKPAGASSVPTAGATHALAKPAVVYGPNSAPGNGANKKRPAYHIASSAGKNPQPQPVLHTSHSGTSDKIPSNNHPFPSFSGPISGGPPPHVSTSATKRPYIRTKRPKNYSDKSTITSTTDALYEKSVHPYDAVLAEAKDLLAAASEAQQLGRVKMASTYLLLLHARLVGLGRRFDKTSVAEDGTSLAVAKNEASAKESAAVPSIADGLLTPKSRAVKEFTKLLPKDIQMDQAMMEHLAKAAVELHSARSKKHRDPKHHMTESHQPQLHQPKGLYVADTNAFLSATANRQGIATAATATAAARAVSGPGSRAPATKMDRKSVATGIAWTDDEIQILNRTRADSMNSDQLASLLPGRSEQQVKTYLKNQNERQRVQLETMESLNDHADRQHDHPPLHSGSSPIEQPAVLSSASQQKPLDVAASGAAAAAASQPSRGRKPATAAFYTAPNAICDARALLSHIRQQALSRQEDQEAADPTTHRSTPSKSPT